MDANTYLTELHKSGWFAKTAKSLCRMLKGVDWQDVAQVGAIAAWKGYETFDPKAKMGSGDAPNRDAWVKAKARWAMLTDVQRAQTNGHKLNEQPTAFEVEGDTGSAIFGVHLDPEPVDASVTAEVRAAVLCDLSPRQREYVVRRFWLDQTRTEIRDAFGYYPETGMWYGSARAPGAKGRLRESLAHLAG